jgi:hypothetical protein
MIGNEKLSLSGAAVSTIATVLFFSSIIVATTGMAARAWLSGSMHSIIACIRASSGHNQKHSYAAQPLHTSFESVFSLCYGTSIFALLLMVLYLLEYHPPFPHASRDSDNGFDADYTAFLLIGIFLWSLTTISRNDGKKIRGGGSSRNGQGSTSPSDKKNLMDDTDIKSEANSTLNNIGITSAASTSPLESHTGFSLIEMTQNRPLHTATVDSGSDDGVPNLLKSSTSDHDSDSDTEVSMQSSSSSHGMISPLNDLLSKPQTSELKGLCEVIFLVTQYTHAKTIPQYTTNSTFHLFVLNRIPSIFLLLYHKGLLNSAASAELLSNQHLGYILVFITEHILLCLLCLYAAFCLLFNGLPHHGCWIQSINRCCKHQADAHCTYILRPTPIVKLLQVWP